MYKTAKETLMYRTVLWTLWERERVGRFGRMALKRVISCMKRKKKYPRYFLFLTPLLLFQIRIILALIRI